MSQKIEKSTVQEVLKEKAKAFKEEYGKLCEKYDMEITHFVTVAIRPRIKPDVNAEQKLDEVLKKLSEINKDSNQKEQKEKEVK